MSAKTTLANVPPTLFIVQNRSILTPDLIDRLITELPTSLGLAFEILKKGRDQVLLMAVPRWLLIRHPEIKVLEIEDYLTSIIQTGVNINCLHFVDPKLKIIQTDLLKNLFAKIDLRSTESIFIQFITKPNTPNSTDLDANVRVIITAADAGRSTEIEQTFLTLIRDAATLVPNSKSQNSAQIMKNYQARKFVKIESLSCPISSEEVTAFLL